MKTVTLILSSFFIVSTAFAQPRVPADSAASHIGEIVTICTKVFGVKSFDKVTLINVGAPYPKSPLTLAIFSKNSSKFTTPIESYKGKEICIVGKIEEYKGKPEIVINDPGQITVQASAPQVLEERQ